MPELVVAPIVEGHGDEQAVPILLRRIHFELLDNSDLIVLRPIRVPRAKLTKEEELLRAVSLAALKLKEIDASRCLILVIFDADDDAACTVAPKLTNFVRTARPDLDVAVVLAVREYETWFVAAAESLGNYLGAAAVEVPSDPEATGARKGWIQAHMRQTRKYSETIEQAAMTAKMDLKLCRSRSASFDKLCRELEKRVAPH